MTIHTERQTSRQERLPTALGSIALALFTCGPGWAADVAVHSSNRYYQDATGQPMFLIGYYAWSAVPDGYFIDHPSRYAEMMQQGAPYRINYIRIGTQGNRMTAATNPPSYNGQPTPVGFLYVNGKADLNQFDPTFWNGLKAQCALGQSLGITVHLAFFDGVSARPGPSWGYSGSYWNPANQVAAFYPNPDLNSNGGIDEVGEAYRTAEFNNGNPAPGTISFYEKRHIDKVLLETAQYSNVMYEVGNELGADSAWNTAVIAYIRARTSKPVTQGGNENLAVLGSGAQGWTPHDADTVPLVKSRVAAIVGRGYPAWEDTDNNSWSCNFGYCNCHPNCGSAWAAQDTGVRQAAWYSFAGGAAAYGGFSIDWWDWWAPTARGFSPTAAAYCKHLQDFIADSGVQFWTMVPNHGLVSNGNSTNSCLTNVGLVPQASVEYVVYVLADASVNLDLTGVTGNRNYRLYDPQTNIWDNPQSVAGGGIRTFNKPPAAADWVIYFGNGGPAPSCPPPVTTVTQLTLGSGVMPSIATDGLGNLHAIFISGGNIVYRKYDPSLTLQLSETIAPPSGAHYPHIMCDSSSVPHITFTDATPDYANFIYYTNRIGGSWKSVVTAFVAGAGNNVWYPRIGLWNDFAYIGFQYGGNSIPLGGRVIRLSNLSTTPATDLSVSTGMRSGIAVNGLGRVLTIGRNGAAGTYSQEFDQNLNQVVPLNQVMSGYPGGSQAAWSDRNNVTHFVAWSIQADGPGACNDRCGMNYNNTGRRNANGTYQSPIQGLLGGLYGSGPDGFDGSNSGFWNDDVAPVIAADALGTVYVAWRNWTPAGEGQITRVNNTQFTQFCTPESSCGTHICVGTQFTPNVTRRRWWNCELAPAQHGGVYVAWDDSGTAYVKPVDVQSLSATEVSIDLGAPDTPNGMTHPQNDDGNTMPATIGGRDCHRNVNPAVDGYMYFGVADAFAYQGSRPDVYVIVDYYDSGAGSLTLQYDSIGPSDIPHQYAHGGSVGLTNTNTWKSASFHLTDAYLGNRQNAGADFRFARGGNTFYLDVVRVSTQPPVIPIIAPVTPNPQVAQPGVPYTLMPSITQGYPAPTWTLAQGPPGATAAPACGLVTGWTPSGIGCYTLTLLAANAAGDDTETWSVCVLSTRDFDRDTDVDLSDFAHLQRCFSGEAVLYAGGCSEADLDSDLDVDAADFTAFLPCMNGADRTPGC